MGQQITFERDQKAAAIDRLATAAVVEYNSGSCRVGIWTASCEYVVDRILNIVSEDLIPSDEFRTLSKQVLTETDTKFTWRANACAVSLCISCHGGSRTNSVKSTDVRFCWHRSIPPCWMNITAYVWTPSPGSRYCILVTRFEGFWLSSRGFRILQFTYSIKSW